MDALEAINTRVSVRKYTPDPVPHALIEELLNAAMNAPSSHNGQPWHFFIIEDRQVMNKIPSFHPHCPMLRESPAAIIVCADLKISIHNGDFWVQDCSAASENLLLAAHALGLGAVWLAVYPKMDIVAALKDLLQLPPNITPLNIIPLGFPTSQRTRPSRYQPSRVHWGKW